MIHEALSIASISRAMKSCCVGHRSAELGQPTSRASRQGARATCSAARNAASASSNCCSPRIASSRRTLRNMRGFRNGPARRLFDRLIEFGTVPGGRVFGFMACEAIMSRGKRREAEASFDIELDVLPFAPARQNPQSSAVREPRCPRDSSAAAQTSVFGRQNPVHFGRQPEQGQKDHDRWLRPRRATLW